VPVIPGKTLLFLDEIQSCPDALRALRFFHEKLPDLHVAAAGSLLEFALEDIPSFGVGRIEMLFMYPMNFFEFLRATENEYLVPALEAANSEHPLEPALHLKLLDRLKMYQIAGGLPEVVSAFRERRDLLACQEILAAHVNTLQADFAKYRKRSSVIKLQETWRAVSRQAGGKFKFSRIIDGASSHGYQTALQLLTQAGLVIKVFHTAARGIPLGAQMDIRKFKALPFDLGVHQRLMGLDLSRQMVAGPVEMVNKGNLAEIFVGLEIIAGSPPWMEPQLYYWHRESPGSNAEVDYVIQGGEKIIPLEVKAGTKGQMQSMRQFLEERGLDRGIRLSQENFGEFEYITTMPLYAASRVVN
jgi:predicted AAA+ superfamily ATPase